MNLYFNFLNKLFLFESKTFTSITEKLQKHANYINKLRGANTNPVLSLLGALMCYAEKDRNTDNTWGEQADGHEQHMFFFMQVELLQTNLELH